MSDYDDYYDDYDYDDDYDDYDDYGGGVKPKAVVAPKKPAAANNNNKQQNNNNNNKQNNNNNNKQQNNNNNNNNKQNNNNNNNKQPQQQNNNNNNNKGKATAKKNEPIPTAALLQQQSLTSQSSGKIVTATDLAPTTWITEKNKTLSELYTQQDRFNAQSIHLLVIGHVDTGKSSLLGRLLLNTQRATKNQYDTLQREANAMGKGSFALAWLCDAQSSERERGITVDISSKYLKTADNKTCYIWDCPGHRDFVGNMLSAANHAKSALLMVSARSGEFESGVQGGQTYEHALLAYGCGVRDLIVVVNKMDQVDWSVERYIQVCRDVKRMLGQIGFDVNPQNCHVRFVPVSAKNDVNIGYYLTNTATNAKVDKTDLPSELTAWYGNNNPTLIDLINTLPTDNYFLDAPDNNGVNTTTSNKIQQEFVPTPINGPNPNPLTIAIHETYTDTINGLCVQGKVLTGSCCVKEKVVLIPSGLVATIRGIQCGDTLVNGCFAGDVVTLQVKLVNNTEDTANAMGTIVVTEPLTQPTFGKKIVAQICAEMTMSAMPILPGQSLLIYTQHIYALGRIEKILYTKSRGGEDGGGANCSNSKKMISNHSMSIVEIVLETPLPLVYLNNFKKTVALCEAAKETGTVAAITPEQYGNIPIDRLCLRRDNETVATGVVIDCIQQQYYDFIA